MNRIKGVEAIFGDYAFEISACSVIKEDDDGCKDSSGKTIAHHKMKCKSQLPWSLLGAAYRISTYPRSNGLNMQDIKQSNHHTPPQS